MVGSLDCRFLLGRCERTCLWMPRWTSAPQLSPLGSQSEPFLDPEEEENLRF